MSCKYNIEWAQVGRQIPVGRQPFSIPALTNYNEYIKRVILPLLPFMFLVFCISHKLQKLFHSINKCNSLKGLLFQLGRETNRKTFNYSGLFWIVWYSSYKNSFWHCSVEFSSRIEYKTCFIELKMECSNNSRKCKTTSTQTFHFILFWGVKLSDTKLLYALKVVSVYWFWTQRKLVMSYKLQILSNVTSFDLYLQSYS